MAFSRRTLPINPSVLNQWNRLLQQEKALREQQVSELQTQIDELRKNTSISDMPDYLNAFVIWSRINQGESKVPIIKVNAPCWILDTSAGYDGDNQDCTIAIGGSPTAWNNLTTKKLLGLQGVCSDDNKGGAFMAPVYPGTSTYAALSWSRSGTLGSYMYLIPTVSTIKYFDQMGINYSRLYTDTGVLVPSNVTHSRSKIAIPGSNEWRAIFQGDWRDNF